MYSTPKTKWYKVSRQHRCPICGRPDWCLYAGPAHSPDAAICARIESDKIVGTKGAGWLHRLHDDGDSWHDRPRQVRIKAADVEGRTDFANIAAECFCDHTCIALAAKLGVSARSLRRLQVGWAGLFESFTFPMRTGDGDVCGIRLRRRDGSKWAVKGSRQGIFIPERAYNCADRLLVCEGPTDTAALADLGFDVIGRPSCNGGNDCVLGFVLADGRFVPREVIVVADTDGPGEHGAWKLASHLVGYVPGGVRIVTPPSGIKDAREWVTKGATKFDVEAAIDAAPIMQLRYGVKGGAR